MYYTKYRPQKFSEILKPNDTAVALMTQVSNKKTVHAYLFVGPRGTGKTTTARILAKALNCTKLDKTGDPCGTCQNCENIQKGTFLDLIEIDAASNRGIDDIRELKDKIKLAPSIGEYKVYIIDEVHMLTKEAFNALLKTLEEPPKHAVFILCTTELHKVPDTIKSRCQLFKLKRATKAQLVKKLEEICKVEGVTTVSTDDLEKIAEASFGGFRDAETMLQQVVEGNLDPQSFVGLSSQQLYVDFVDNLLAKDTRSAIGQINKLVEDGLDLNVWVFDLLTYLRDMLFVSADAYEGLVDTTGEIFKAMQEQASKIKVRELIVYIDAFMTAGNSLTDSVIPQLPLELAVISLTRGSSVARQTDDSEDDDNDDDGNAGDAEPTATSSTHDFDSTTDFKVHQHPSQEPDQRLQATTDLSEELLTHPTKKTAKNSAQNNSKKNTPTNDAQLTEFIKAWDEIVKASVQHNNSIHALLKSAKPIEFADDTLYLEVYYSFHKERLEATKNRTIVEEVIAEVTTIPVRIKCTRSDKPPVKTDTNKLESGDLTDYNVKVPVLSDETLSDIFDGALPL